MTTFSVPQDYSITSTDTITLTPTISTITLSGLGSGYSIGGASGAGTISIGNICTGSTYTTASTTYTTSFDSSSIWGEEWVNGFPNWDRVQRMCEEYPGLKIAFEKFKTTYKLVKDHYDTPEDQRPRT